MKTLISLLLAVLLASPLAAQVRPKQLDTSENVTMTGGAEVLGLPAVPSATGAASKEYVNSQTTLDTEAGTLTALATSFTPQGADILNLFGSATTLPGDVDMNAEFKDTLDADFATGSSTHTTEAGSPAQLSGAVEMLDDGAGTPDVNALSYPRLAGNIAGGSGAVRVTWISGFTGGPGTSANDTVNFFTATNELASANRRNIVRLFGYRNGSNISFVFWVYNSGNNIRVDLNPAATTTIVAGQEYELEGNWDATTGAGYLFLDGTLLASGTTSAFTLTGNITGAKVIVGGESGANWFSTNGDSAPGGSDFKITSFAVFDAVQHTSGYTATGPPSAGTVDETITTLVSTNYEEGESLSVVCQEADRYTLQNGTAPFTSGEMELNTDHDPNAVGQSLQLRRADDGHWIETGRFPTSAPSLPSVDNVIPKFDGTGGALQVTGVDIDDSDNMTVPGEVTLGDGTAAVATLKFDTALGGAAEPEFEWEDNSTNHGPGHSLRNNAGERTLFIEGNDPGGSGTFAFFPDEQIHLDATDRDYFMGFGRHGTSSASRGITLNLGTQARPAPFDDAVDGEYSENSFVGPHYFTGAAIVANGTFNGSAFNGSGQVGIANIGELLFHGARGIRWVPDQGASSGDPDDQPTVNPALIYGAGTAAFHNKSVQALWLTTTTGGSVVSAAGSELAAHYNDAAMPMLWNEGMGVGTRVGPLIVGYSSAFVSDEPVAAFAYEEDLSAGTKRIPIRWGTNATQQEIAYEENSGNGFFDFTAPIQVKRIGLGASEPITLGVAASVIDPANDTGYIKLTGDSGGNTIVTITSTGFSDGDKLTIFVVTDSSGTLAFTDSGTGATADQLNLSAALTMNADDMLELLFEGTHWVELSRSLN